MGVLFADDQKQIETIANTLVATPTMQKKKQSVVEDFRSFPVYAMPAGQSTLANAIDELAYAAALYAANSDPSRPLLIWNITGPITWDGHKTAGSRWIGDTPDNLYRFFPVDGASRYEIHARTTKPLPAQFSILLWDTFMGEDSKQIIGEEIKFLDKPIGGLLSRDITIAPDGSFTITIDSDPANGRVNHIQSNPDARLAFVRDTFSDWAAQNPLDIEIRRVGGPAPGTVLGFDELVARNATIFAAAAIALRWYLETGFANERPNMLPTPWFRGGGLGFAATGQFDLAPDEAWVIDLHPLGASYLGSVVWDPWAVSRESTHRTGSLNLAQAEPNSDGSYTYVLGPHDPGICNWLDTEGFLQGFVMFRWQAVPDGLTSTAGAVRTTKVVKLTDLPQHLPTGITRFTPEMRRAQYGERARTIRRHYGLAQA